MPYLTQMSVEVAAAPGRRRRVVVFGVLLVALVAAVFASLAIGTRTNAPSEVFAMLGGDREDTAGLIWDLRVPRTLVGLMVGVALGAAGALAQQVTRNPLADPGLIGVASGAAFAVASAVALFGLTGPYTAVWFAFAGAAAAGAVAYGVGGRGRGGATPAKLALAGVAVSALLDAATGALVLSDPEALSRYRAWAVGSLTGRDADDAWQFLPFVVAGLVLAFVISPRLNALALGDDTATALGARAGTTRALGALAVVLLTGSAVAAAGPIVFAGLAVPHIVGAFTGPDARQLIPASAIGGAVLLLSADVVGRVVARPTEVEVGVVTAFLGGPFLIALVKIGKLREHAR